MNSPKKKDDWFKEGGDHVLECPSVWNQFKLDCTWIVMNDFNHVLCVDAMLTSRNTL